MKSRFLVLTLAAAFLLAATLEVGGPGIGQAGASPLNPGYDGTSLLAAYLASRGSDVKIITSWRNLPPQLSDYGMIFIISPEGPYSADELEVIKDLHSRGYTIVVADEGTYSNAVLEALNVPIRVKGSILSMHNSPLVTAEFNLSWFSGRLTLAYASAIEVGEGAAPFAYVNGFVVSAQYDGAEGTVYVFGDGSIFTNAALNPLSPLNPYVSMLDVLVRKSCEETQCSVVIDASKYRLRPLGVEEMVAAGYSPAKVLAGLINPARYGLALSEGLLGPNPAGVALAIATSLFLIYLILKRMVPRVGGISGIRRPRLRGYGRVEDNEAWKVITLACSDNYLRNRLMDVCESGRTSDLSYVIRRINDLLAQDPNAFKKISGAVMGNTAIE